MPHLVLLGVCAWPSRWPPSTTPSCARPGR